MRLKEDLARSEAVAAGPTGRVPRSRLVGGGEFALDEVERPAVWGRADEVAWPSGEPLLIVGPTGVGHTTVTQRLILSRLGIRPPEVLGLPVERSDRPILYVAADRPRQARRSLRRMVTEADREQLEARLYVWEGPPEFDIARSPERLAEWAVDLEVGTVVIDALKDVTTRLKEDETGTGVVRAWNLLLGEEVEVLTNHHQRKGTNDNPKPRTLDDVYGSTFITAGAGSVILLWGRAGDPIVEVSQLKQAAGEVGPFRVALAHDTGDVEVVEGTDVLALLRRAPRGLAAKDAARLAYGSSDPSDSEVEKARRQLNRLKERGLAHRRPGQAVRGAVKAPDVYLATADADVQEELR